ncbi:MAG: hypothetical protein JKY53_10445 [Flavobacteriales bacterium]|nr:hypothetical protein [Flavobacteriales bacterium]
MLIKIYIFTAFFLVTLVSFSQNDVIFMQDGTEIKAKVEEVGTKEIKYRKASNLDGPIYSTDISVVFMIKYANGEKDVFKEKNSPSKTTIIELPEWDENPYEGRDSVNSNAREYQKEELFTERSMVYYGVDFANVRMIGSRSFGDSQYIVENNFQSINSQILVEESKYNWAQAFRKTTIENDIEMVAYPNKNVDPYSIVIDEMYTISTEEVQQIVSKYNPKQQEGIGFVIIMETLNKTNELGSMYFVFFDIKTKKVLLAEKKIGIASGFGTRNYWMKPVYESLKQWNETH